jgi:hypothetical protein
MVRRTMPPAPTHYSDGDSITFDAPCPSCGGEVEWTATRTLGSSDLGGPADHPTYVINCCPKEENVIEMRPTVGFGNHPASGTDSSAAPGDL